MTKILWRKKTAKMSFSSSDMPGMVEYNTTEFDRMAWFKAFRNEYDYTAYGDNRSAVTIDIKLVVVIYASIIVSVATLIATIGIRGKERWWTFLRVLYSLFIGTSILVSIFGHGWQTGSTRTQSYYTFISGQKFDGQVGLMMGLSSVNITLSGHVGRHRSQVDYNERMGWFDVGQVQSEYRGCLEKGLPEPILSVAAYFSYDAGGLRFGRSYQNAGYFAYVLLWSSFSFWLITNVVINSVVFYGSVMFLLSGVCMVLAVIVYHVCQPLYSLRIPFENDELTIHYDWSFWLMLASGCMTTVLGLLLLLLDWKVPKMLSLFFLLDTTFDQDEDETNHNLARSPNENKTTPTKRSYLSLVDFEVSKKVKGSSARVDRQTSTLQGEINHAYRSEQDFRSFGLNTQLSKSDSCIPTLDNSEVGSQIRLVKRDESESVYTVSDSASRSSIESLPFEMQTIPQIVVDIPEDEGSKTMSPTVEKDTHL